MTLVALMHQLKSHFHTLIWIMMGKYYNFHCLNFFYVFISVKNFRLTYEAFLILKAVISR